MAGKDRDEERGFTVVDRRHSSGGSDAPAPEPGTPGAGAPEAPPPGAEGAPPERPAAPPGGPGRGPGVPPSLDFSTFVMSLGTSALYQMGLVAAEEGGAPPEPNLPMARQTIDILAMLQEKTRGNLDAEESHLLESLLYELRMRFVESQR